MLTLYKAQEPIEVEGYSHGKQHCPFLYICYSLINLHDDLFLTNRPESR